VSGAGACNRVRGQFDGYHFGCRADVNHLTVYAGCFTCTSGIVQNPPLIVVAETGAVANTRSIEFFPITAMCLIPLSIDL